MIIEAEAIPYHSTPLRGERLLVLAPHPDDEVIGCGGLLGQHARDGRKIRVVVATDGGAAALEGTDREEECRRGLETLGASTAEVHFLRFPDRALDDGVIAALRDQLTSFRPDLILAPSPVEIHPDHAALSRALCGLIQQDATLFADLAVTRVAFYEVGQPLRPNVLVAIDDVAEIKFAAIRQHRSQLSERDYSELARGLNVYRAMTLPDSRFAEAYYVVDLPRLRTLSFSGLRELVGAPPPIEVREPTISVSVVIRTKDRPKLLREAVESVRATRYPCEIVVVNDGGATPELEGVRVINHPESRGRSAAANAGVEAATGSYVTLLDDDDLLYAEHFEVLARALEGSRHAAHYTDAVSTFLKTGASGSYEAHSTLRLFSHDFDATLLLLDNYIPLPTILIPRQAFRELGGFDPAFDLFEDWDFLIRLSRRGTFLHVPRVTVEVRHFEGGSSILLASPMGSERFRAAKRQVWTKHGELLNDDVFSSGLEEQKRRINTLYSDAVEARGALAFTHRDIERVERDKGVLLGQIQELHHAVNGHVMRVRDLEAAIKAADATMAAANATNAAHVGSLTSELEQLRAIERQQADSLKAASVEIDRLNDLLAMIFRSRTWKMHNLVERLKGRG